MTVFSDFECPFCSKGAQTLAALEERYAGRLRVAFKHQPMPFHANAKLASAAALAAGEQGKFWEYHDLLFANQRALDRSSLERYAQQLGLSVPRFREALDSGRYDAQIEADSAEARRLGVTGTPTFFINDRMVVGVQPLPAFTALIDEELARVAPGRKGG